MNLSLSKLFFSSVSIPIVFPVPVGPQKRGWNPFSISILMSKLTLIESDVGTMTSWKETSFGTV